MKRAGPFVFLVILLAGGAVLVFSDSGFPASPRADVRKGEALYARKCAVCHGREGKGDGPAEFVLFPKPRDLTSGKFKIRSTPTLPTSDDLFRVITRGIPGTAMPGWAALPESERWDLVAYVKHLSPAFARFAAAKPVRIPPAPKATPALLEVGKKFYVEAECLKCHGETGRGDGEAADTLKDEWGAPIVPYDFTIPGRMKGGNTASDVYRALVTGIGGTPMPSYGDSLSEREMWGLAYYTMSLAQQPETKAPPEAGIVVVRRVTDDLRVDPNALVWRKAGLQAVPLRTLWLRPNTIDQVSVVALHNGREIGFLLEWDDPISHREVPRRRGHPVPAPGCRPPRGRPSRTELRDGGRPRSREHLVLEGRLAARGDARSGPGRSLRHDPFLCAPPSLPPSRT